MPKHSIEYLPYRGESAQSRKAFLEYQEDIKRGKGLLQLTRMRGAMTPEIRAAWSERSFTPVVTEEGIFDAITCNASYHFNEHGNKHGNDFDCISSMTSAARKYFNSARQQAIPTQGLLKFPDGSLYELDGRIVTFISGKP